MRVPFLWYDECVLFIIEEIMAVELTEEEVRHVAFLARVGVTDEDVKKYQKDLSSVLAYFDELNAVNTDNVEPIGHITGMTNVFRSDNVHDVDEDTKRRIMENVPETKDGYIKVKSIF